VPDLLTCLCICDTSKLLYRSGAMYARHDTSRPIALRSIDVLTPKKKTGMILVMQILD